MYNPDEWVTLLRNMRTKHSRITVENLTNEVIMDYKAFSEGMKNFHVGNCGTKVKWTVVKIIQLRKEPELTVFWKNDYESRDFIEINLIYKLTRKRNLNMIGTSSLVLKRAFKKPRTLTKEKIYDLKYTIEKRNNSCKSSC